MPDLPPLRRRDRNHATRRALPALAGLAGLAAAAGVAATRRRRARSGRDTPRQLVVTVNRPVAEVRGRPLPGQLTALGERVDLDVRPAPGDRGTEIGATVRSRPPRGVRLVRRLRGSDPHQQVRRALREAKSVLETGEVLQAQSPGSTERTLLGRPLDLATRRSAGEGRL